MKILLFLFPAVMFAQNITITPANPVVNEGGTINIAASIPATFSLSGGGSIQTSANNSVIYSAPGHAAAGNVLAGCPVTPTDSIYNSPIDKLPVSSNSAVWTPFATYNGINVSYQWSENIVTNAAPLLPQTFYYSYLLNGTGFQAPMLPNKIREEGAFATNGSNDHHMVTINRQTCHFYETYQDGAPLGALCPTCTAVSGWTYQSASYQQPRAADGGGSTDAAGLPLAPLTVHLSEIKSGAINHAMRFTACTGCVSRQYLWPAVSSTGGQPGAPPMGARFRLKAGYDVSSYPPAAQALLNGLKKYGMILADLGTSGIISLSSDVTEDPEVSRELGSLWPYGPNSNDFEVVDESSLMVSTDSNRVNPNNPYQTPASYAVLTVTDARNPANQVTVPVVVSPVTVGTANTAVVVQAGTPGFQIQSWVNGSANQNLTWTIDPPQNAGSISSNGTYTAPSSVSSPMSAVLTATSVADPSAIAQVYVTIIPSGAIRIDSGSATPTVDENGNAWLADVGFQSGSYGVVNDNYPAHLWGPISGAVIWQSYMYTWGDDIVYRFHVPNGRYTITYMTAIGNCSGTYTTTPWDNYIINGPVNLQAQNQIVYSSWNMGTSINFQCRTPASVNIPAQVTDTNLTFAIRSVTSGKTQSTAIINGLVITPGMN